VEGIGDQTSGASPAPGKGPPGMDASPTSQIAFAGGKTSTTSGPWSYSRTRGEGRREVSCSVCKHPERESIDRELARGGDTVILGRQYGLTKDALRNHREKHLLYLFDPALGLRPADRLGIRIVAITSMRKEN
jgi:hypothetical protein